MAGRWILLAASLLGLFGGLTVMVVAGRTQILDDGWNTTMTDAEVSWLVSVAQAFHHVGSVPLAIVGTAVFVVLLVVLRRWSLAASWIIIIVAAQLLSTLFKSVVDRPRPTNGLVHESSASYPSGHATVSGAAVAIGLAVVFGLIWPNRYRLFLGVGIFYAVLMAWSRTYLRAHWLTDVIGGLLLGSAVVCLVGWYLVTVVGNSTRPTTDAH